MSEQSAFVSKVVFRDGVAEDWPMVSRVVANTWDGNDYIDEQVWKAWVADPEGQVVVATFNKHVIGLGKVTHLGPAEWWLEGLRVHPDLRERGVARAIMEQNLAWFRQHGDGILRFASYSGNEATSKLATERRFIHTVSYAMMAADAEPGRIHGFKLMEPHNLDMVWNYLRYSPMYRVNTFAEQLWTLYYLTRDRLAEYLASEAVQVIGWRHMGQLHGMGIVFLQPPPGRALDGDTLHVGYLDAPDDTTLNSMLKALRALAAARGLQRVRWKMPTGLGLDRAAEDAGFADEWDHEGFMWLYELPLRA